MSWIIGAVGTIRDELTQKLISSHDKPAQTCREESFYLACGGPQGTYLFKNNIENDSAKGAVIIGPAFKHENGKFSLLNEDSWIKHLSCDADLHAIDGHYCGAYWKDGNVILFSDPSGIFDMHYFQSDGVTYFSNDLLLLNTLMDKTELNTKTFASRWLSVNQFSSDSIIRNIHRLSKGEKLTIEKSGDFTLTARKMEDDMKAGKESAGDNLSDLFSVLLNSGHHISLSLSGGIDSRLLLAILTSLSSKDFSVHTFGPPDDQDSIVASAISKDLGIKHTQLYSKVDSTTDCVSLIKEYVRSTMCINPCSTIFQLMYYPLLYDRKHIIVDGGFGEIGRRQYLNKLLIKKKRAVLNGNADEIFSYSLLGRADIFNEETHHKMVADSKSQIEKLISELPDAKQIGAENWADLFSYHTRLTNFFGVEQKRMGNFVNNLMPFGMKNIFHSIMKIKTKERKNGDAFKEIIRKKNRKLTEFPLAKNNAVYPFNSGFISTRLRIKFQNLRKKPQLNQEENYLKKIKDFALDLLYSKTTKNFGLYDYKKISNNVKSYYEGNESFAKFTDWWLTFEIMRRYIYKEW